MNEEDKAASARRVSAQLNALIPDVLAGLNARINTPGFQRAIANDPGLGRSAEWEAEDGWLIGYSTSRVVGGAFDGKFVVTAHRPLGTGSRSGRGAAGRWKLAYARAFSTRKAAKARALHMYGQHSPRWAARTGRRTSTDEP